MTINYAVLDRLTKQAQESPRLRMHLDLRNGPDDKSQRILNAVEPGSILPIHRHRFSSETVVCVRGKVVEEFFDELERVCTDAIELSHTGPNVLLKIPAGQWHCLRALESGSVVLECKDGSFEPLGEEDILSL